MCATCGCSSREHEHEHDGHVHAHDHRHDERHTVRLEQEVLAKNAAFARENRAWLERSRVVALNLVSSPGAGKTTLLERTIRALQGSVAVSVIEGDQETDRDAARIRATGCRALQINTGAGCHLDAHQVGHAARALEPAAGSLLLIENVGNLVCPALFDLGERAKVVVLSVTEGEDKPLKYPHMFRASDVLVLSKVDLLPYVPFDLEACLGFVHAANPKMRIFLLSTTTGQGMDAWCSWLKELARGD